MLYTTPGSSSGGYLYYILQYAAKELFGITVAPSDIENGTNSIQKIAGRNTDSTTDILHSSKEGSPDLLRFTTSYGFRNIQNVVRKVNGTGFARSKQNAPTPDFVEVMACPSGCINGGGQLKDNAFEKVEMSALSVAAKQLITASEAVYEQGTKESPEDCKGVKDLITDWFGGDETLRKKLLHTCYRGVEKMDATLLF